MESTVSMTAAVHVMRRTVVTEQQENALEDVSQDGKEYFVNNVIF